MKTKINNIFIKSSGAFLLLMALFLPINLFLNNLFLSLFIVVFGLMKIYNNQFFDLKNPKNSLTLFFLLSIPVFLPLIGLLYTSNFKVGLRQIERLLPILFIIYYLLIDRKFFTHHIKKIFLALILGCLASAFISWGLAVFEILRNGHSISMLFSQEYASHNLSEHLGVHTPYLALFLNAAIGYCFFGFYDRTQKVSKYFFLISALILVAFLFNLMARNAIFTLLFFSILILIKQKKHLQLIFLSAFLAGLSFYTFTTEKNFLRDRFFRSINIFEQETIFSKKDNRFARWEVSINVFKQFPIIGPGTSGADQYRKEQYIQNLDSEAYNSDYNAHNQFLEYLSNYGILGGLSFIVLLFTLIKYSFKRKSFFVLYLTGCFIFAGFTESLFDRSWGAVFYILLLITLFSWNLNSKTND